MTDAPPFGTYAPTGFALWAVEKTRRLPDRWAARRFGHMLRRVALRSLGGAPVDVEAFGARLRLYPSNNLCEKRALFSPQFFDRDEFAALKARAREDMVFLDVGASVGLYSLYVASISGPGARILAVEPQPDVFERLIYNIGQNPYGTIKAVACALADKDGDLTLFLNHRNKGESSIQIVDNAHSGSVKVPALSLLGLVEAEGFTRLDAVKLDVEGAEDLILYPFFRDAPPELYPSLLILEDKRVQWQIDLSRLLEGRGYRLIVRSRLNLVFELDAGAAAKAPAAARAAS